MPDSERGGVAEAVPEGAAGRAGRGYRGREGRASRESSGVSSDDLYDRMACGSRGRGR